MRQDDGLLPPRVLEHVVRSSHTLENPPFLFEAAFDVAAIGEHLRAPLAGGC
jgi:hypothetical protein